MSNLPIAGFDNFFTLKEDLYPSAYRGGLNGNLFGSNGLLYALNCETSYIRAYNECAPLKAIISKRAKAFNVGIIDVYNKNTNKPARGGNADAYRVALKSPNPLQTSKQFLAQHNTYIDLFGYCPVYIIRPYGVKDAIQSIWNIPPWLFDLEYTGSWLNQTDSAGIFKGYKISWASGNINLLPENVKLIFDDGFGTDFDINLTIPDSRLRSLEYPISNIVAAYKSRNTLIVKKGAIGILSNVATDTTGALPMREDQKEQLQEDFRRYGITGQEWQVIITEASLQWQQMSFPTKDLMLFEEIQDDIYRICDAYGWDKDLLAQEKGATYENKEKAEKMMYTGTIIPEAESRVEQLSKAIIGNNETFELRISYEHAPALQAERLQNARTRKEMDAALEKEFKNNVITLNMWLSRLKEPERADDFGNMYYYQLLELGWQFGTTTDRQDNQQTEAA